MAPAAGREADAAIRRRNENLCNPMPDLPCSTHDASMPKARRGTASVWLLGLLIGAITYATAFRLRLEEWASWQNAEFRLGNEMLLATHDAYHWVAGAEGFAFGAGHPMSELLRLLALASGTAPSTVAFWLPPIMASLVAVLVFLWAWSLGGREAGFCAGVLASLAPGFLARTLLGYADTDLVTLFLPLLIGLAPACWAMRFLRHPLAILSGKLPGRFAAAWDAPPHRTQEIVRPLWIALLGASGLFSWWAMEWHSMFPYLVRFNALLLGGMALVPARSRERRTALAGSLAYVLPALGGPCGLLFPLVLLVAAAGAEKRFIVLLRRPAVLWALWALTVALVFDRDVIVTMYHHVQAYLKPRAVPLPGTDDPLVFPSVAQSIIEIQDLSLSEMPLYFHPWPALAVIGAIGFCLVSCVRSGALFLLPLLGLALLSAKMGGRMVMFGAPTVALGLALPFDGLVRMLGRVRGDARNATRDDVRPGQICRFAVALLLAAAFLIPHCRRELLDFWANAGDARGPMAICLGIMLFIVVGRIRGWRAVARLDAVGPGFLYRSAAALLLLLATAPPLADLVPAMTQGPIINRRHADALRAVRNATPPDAMIWLWWDWGYAAHHFSRRDTIADGAEHGGPSLFLPAAVFTTDDPRYARQIIKYTAVNGNVPGNVFRGMTGIEAQRLMRELKNRKMPLINAPGKQYVIVSFDMLDLGFWISTFGNWDFTAREGRGYAISIVPQALSYRLDRGEVVMKSANVMVPAASIDIFADGGLVHRDYVTPPQFLPDNNAINAWREDVERRRNVHFLFNKVTGEKLVVDDRMYGSLMVQLLIGKPNAPCFAPYFRLIYDNIFCRVYEVL